MRNNLGVTTGAAIVFVEFGRISAQRQLRENRFEPARKLSLIGMV
jgi:hypothetical protein